MRDGAPALELGSYLGSGAFVSSVFENWESEFLQMGTYVMLTAYLFQRGSPEPKDPDKPSPQDRDPKLDADKKDAPWPVRAGAIVRTLYAHSLGLGLVLLFGVSFVLHLLGSASDAAEKAIALGEAPPTVVDHLGSAQFWFESSRTGRASFFLPAC